MCLYSGMTFASHGFSLPCRDCHCVSHGYQKATLVESGDCLRQAGVLPLTLRLTVGTGGGGLMNFSRTANRTWRRGNPGAWQVIGWEPAGCAQAQQSSPKVTSSSLGSPCSPEEPKNTTYTGMSSGLSCGKLKQKGHPNQFSLQWTVLLTLFFPEDFHSAMKLGQRKKNNQTASTSTHIHTLEHTCVCSHACVFTHTHAHIGVPEHTNAHARPLALTGMNIKAVHLASCPPPCLVRFLWLTPPVSKSHSQSPVVHPNFHGVSQD